MITKELLISITGWLNMLILSLITFPQIWKTVKTKSVAGVSIWVYYLLLVGNIDALIYAVLISQPPLILKYLLGLSTASIYVYLYHKYKK